MAHWQNVDTISVFSGVSSGSKSTVGKVRLSPTTTYDSSDCNHNKAAAATCSPARAEPGQPRKFQWESNLLLKPARLAVYDVPSELQNIRLPPLFLDSWEDGGKDYFPKSEQMPL